MIQDGPMGAVTQAGLGGGKEACGICNNTGRIRKDDGNVGHGAVLLMWVFPSLSWCDSFYSQICVPSEPFGLDLFFLCMTKEVGGFTLKKYFHGSHLENCSYVLLLQLPFFSILFYRHR